jgi:hypothetical protein
MLRNLGFAVAVAVAAGAAGTASAAHLGTHQSGSSLGRSGIGGNYGYPGAGRLGVPRVSSGYASSPHGLSGHSAGGWYGRGFGGNANPGWDYGFGPHLGGVGR